MALERSFERTMTSALYAALGISVTYTPTVGSPSSIYSIPVDSSDQYATALGVQVSESTQLYRVKKTDIAQPVRGDTITDADSNVFTVENYSDENAVEWILTLRES